MTQTPSLRPLQALAEKARDIAENDVGAYARNFVLIPLCNGVDALVEEVIASREALKTLRRLTDFVGALPSDDATIAAYEEGLAALDHGSRGT